MEQGIKSAEKVVSSVIDFFVNHGFQVIGARVVLIADFIVARLAFSFLSKALRIAEGEVGISYQSNPEEAIGIIKSILDGFDDISRDPASLVGIKAFGDWSITIAYRYWVPTQKYFNLRYQLNLAVFTRLKTAQIEIPFPQREVRIVPPHGQDRSNTEASAPS
jgi:small-conductance mechanosensitive channel